MWICRPMGRPEAIGAALLGLSISASSALAAPQHAYLMEFTNRTRQAVSHCGQSSELLRVEIEVDSAGALAPGSPAFDGNLAPAHACLLAGLRGLFPDPDFAKALGTEPVIIQLRGWDLGRDSAP